MVGRITDRRVATYGFSPQADVQGRNLRYENGGACFDVALNAEGRAIEGVTLPMTGDHNVSNALAAIAVARHLGVAADGDQGGAGGLRRGEPAVHQGRASGTASPSSTTTATIRWRSRRC